MACPPPDAGLRMNNDQINKTVPSRQMVSVVAPFLNEAVNLPLLYERVASVMAPQPEAWELLLVDDGSTDGSAAWARTKAQEDPRVRLLQLSRNYGHQIAITAGLDHARGDAVVIIDADLQDPPEVIPDLLAKWREGCEVVYAVRNSRAGETWLKKFLAAAFYRFFRALSPVDVPLNAGDFRLLDRQVVTALREVRELHRFMRGLTCWVGYRHAAVYYDRAVRHAGETKYPMWKSVRLAFDAITSFSGVPLLWVTGLGGSIALAGALFLVWLVIGRIRHPELARGWASLMAIVLFLGGIQLLCLGVIGQYISRIYEEGKRRPLYFLRKDKSIL